MCGGKLLTYWALQLMVVVRTPAMMVVRGAVVADAGQAYQLAIAGKKVDVARGKLGLQHKGEKQCDNQGPVRGLPPGAGANRRIQGIGHSIELTARNRLCTTLVQRGPRLQW